MAEVDAENPGDVAANLVGRFFRLIEELLGGKIIERDFREEFLTYWFYGADPDAPRIWSLVWPGPPSRVVRVWRDGKGLVVVGEDQASVEQWLTALRALWCGRARLHCRPARRRGAQSFALAAGTVERSAVAG
jgi:hypothetical protein